MIRPHGGHPIPERHPIISIKPKTIAILSDGWAGLKGMTPVRIMTRADGIKPSTRNFRASERSDMLPRMNLLNA